MDKKKWIVSNEEGKSQGSLIDFLNEKYIKFEVDEHTGYLAIDFSEGDRDITKLYLDMIFESLGGSYDSKSDFLLHGSKVDLLGLSVEDASEKISSFFENGILASPHSGGNILGTASLQKRDCENSYANKVVDYHFSESSTFVINIPREYQGMYFGNILRQDFEGNSLEETTYGHNSGNHCSLDFLDIKKIPKEFIVGVFVKDNVIDENNPDQFSDKFFLNPNYLFFNNNKQKTADGKAISNIDALKATIRTAPGFETFLTNLKFRRENELLLKAKSEKGIIENVSFDKGKEPSAEDYSFTAETEKTDNNEYDFEDENGHENQRNKPGNLQ